MKLKLKWREMKIVSPAGGYVRLPPDRMSTLSTREWLKLNNIYAFLESLDLSKKEIGNSVLRKWPT
jgi:hypothetical protein